MGVNFYFMKDFDSFYLKLTSEQAWFEAIQMTYRNKDYKQVAMECYTWLLTQSQLWASQDYTRYRQSYQKFLLYSKDKEQIIIPPKAVPVSIHPDALEGEARLQKLKEWKELVSKAEVKAPPKLTSEQIKEEGGWIAKKVPAYPSTSPAEVTKRILHLEYIKANYDKDGNPLPDWMDENIWLHLQSL